jgi:hypothetical protein
MKLKIKKYSKRIPTWIIPNSYCVVCGQNFVDDNTFSAVVIQLDNNDIVWTHHKCFNEFCEECRDSDIS